MRSTRRWIWECAQQPVAVALAALSLFVLTAAAPNLDFDLSPRKITIGDPIEVSITITAPPGGTVTWPAAEQFAPAEIIKSDTTQSKGDRRSIRYTISLFEPGSKKLPVLPILLVTPSGTDTLWVDPGMIEVVSSATDTTLRDIRPPKLIPWTFKEMLPYIIGGLAALGLAALAYYLWRKAKLRRGEIPVYIPPPPPPDVTAMRRLEELRVKRLWQDGHVKEYHSELTDILKEYLGTRYDFNAPEMTSEELLIERKRWAESDDLFSSMRRILNIADFVKFAKFKPDPHDHEKSLELAFSFVEATRPRAEVTAVAA